MCVFFFFEWALLYVYFMVYMKTQNHVPAVVAARSFLYCGSKKRHISIYNGRFIAMAEKKDRC